MYYKVSDILFKEIIPNSLKKTGLTILVNYFYEFREWLKKKLEAENQEGE